MFNRIKNLFKKKPQPVAAAQPQLPRAEVFHNVNAIPPLVYKRPAHPTPAAARYESRERTSDDDQTVSMLLAINLYNSMTSAAPSPAPSYTCTIPSPSPAYEAPTSSTYESSSSYSSSSDYSSSSSSDSSCSSSTDW